MVNQRVANGFRQRRRHRPAIEVFGPLRELVVQPLEPFEGGEFEAKFGRSPRIEGNRSQVPEHFPEAALGFTVEFGIPPAWAILRRGGEDDPRRKPAFDVSRFGYALRVQE